MSTEIDIWFDGCDARLQDIAQTIESISSSTRKIRAQALAFDKAVAAHQQVIFSGTLSDEFLTLASSLEKLSNESELKRFLTGPAAKFTSPDELATLVCSIDPLREKLAGIAASSPNVEQTVSATTDTKPRRQPTFLQKGGRHFSTLSGILQLRDCFDQRVEHIAHGMALARNDTDASQSLMIQVLNAQAAGLATMITDFTDTAREASDALKGLHEEAYAKLLERDPMTEAQAKHVSSQVIVPLEDFASKARSVCDDIQSAVARRADPSGSVSDEVAFAKKVLEEALIHSLDGLESTLLNIRSHHPRLVDANVRVGLTESYLELESSVSMLRSLSTELEQHAAELTSDQCIELPPTASTRTALESFAGSFTMEMERKDHLAALSRLGLEQL